jgi:hypothetical protein
MGDLAAFLRTSVLEADAVIGRLQAEVANLKALLAAKLIEGSTGIYTVTMTGTPTAEQFAYLQNLWNEKWWQQGANPPPGLFPLVDGVSIDKLEHDGFGLFIIRVPDDMKVEQAAHLAHAWDASWAKTETPHVPMMVMAAGLRLERLTERQMQSIGYMRIPDELTGPG